MNQGNPRAPLTADGRVQEAAVGERLCYYCNEGHCALCTGWDRTVVEGHVVEVPCAHGCREQRRKPNQRVVEREVRSKRA